MRRNQPRAFPKHPWLFAPFPAKSFHFAPLGKDVKRNGPETKIRGIFVPAYRFA